MPITGIKPAITKDGKKITKSAELAEFTGLSQGGAAHRWRKWKDGEISEKDLLRPAQTQSTKHPVDYVVNGKRYTSGKELAAALGISLSGLYNRLSNYHHGKINKDELLMVGLQVPNT